MFLILVAKAGYQDVLVYYLPFSTTLTLLNRAREQSTRSQRKYGSAWESYTKEVKANIFPKVY